MSVGEGHKTLTVGLSIVALATAWQAVGTVIIGALSTPSVSAILSFAAFASAAAYCGLQAAVSKRVGPIREMLRERTARRLVLVQNTMTAGVFVSFYFSLAFVPATVASVVEAGIGPLVAAVLTVQRGRFGAARRYVFPSLMTGVTAVIVVLSLSSSSRAAAAYPVGLVLAACAGVCGVGVVLCSMKLVALGFNATDINATRFHGAWLVSGIAVLLSGLPRDSSALPVMLLVGVALGAAPLVVLQFGITRSQPLPTELVMSSLPALVFVGESIIGRGFDITIATWMVALLVCSVFAVFAERRYAETSGSSASSGLSS